ncbi:uncharacterized protein METZ01_LOCUS174528, partial [marine metagenome]
TYLVYTTHARITDEQRAIRYRRESDPCRRRPGGSTGYHSGSGARPELRV